MIARLVRRTNRGSQTYITPGFPRLRSKADNVSRSKVSRGVRAISIQALVLPLAIRVRAAHSRSRFRFAPLRILSKAANAGSVEALPRCTMPSFIDLWPSSPELMHEASTFALSWVTVPTRPKKQAARYAGRLGDRASPSARTDLSITPGKRPPPLIRRLRL